MRRAGFGSAALARRSWLRRAGLRRVARADGQVLVLFALAITTLLAFAGLAFDVGRFYSERRFLQNAADAGALAAGNALIRGESQADALSEARDVIARNALGSPNGSTLNPPSEIPVYEPGFAGNPAYLSDGILITGNDVRVAISADVEYTFGRVVGLASNRIAVRARARTRGDLLPIAARRYINAPGPWVGATYPCPDDRNRFQDLISTQETACLGTETDASLRTAPSEGMPFDPANPGSDPVNHGPIIALVGEGASPSNAADFRGFIALDIRNFQSPNSNVFYNGVTAGTRENELKGIEAGWVSIGYPGPDLPPATIPADPNDQVAILSGNAAGIVVDAMAKRYAPGEEILLGVYSGTVMKIPDFVYSVPNTVSIATTQNRDNEVSMSVSKNNAFAGTVTTTAFSDAGDATNPYGGTLVPLTFTPEPATPPTTVRWATFRTAAAPVGVFTIWIRAASSSPYLSEDFYPVAINIGGVVRDFSSDGANTAITAATAGATATGTMAFSTPNNNATFLGGTVNLSIEGPPQSSRAMPSGIGAATVSPSTFTLNKGARQSVTVTINSGSLAPGQYPLVIRARGTNSAGQTITRLIPFLLNVATGGTSNEYVDIIGFALFRITSIDSNTLYGYAISGVYADMNDPALRRGQVARLVPWT